MYVPKSNQQTNKKQIVEFMQRFSFGTIITANENLPIATHLPFLISLKGEEIIIRSHFAKANGQWNSIAKNKVLVIFCEPHAYISPKNYDKDLNVPTWNYISVHAYGKGKIIAEPERVSELLESTIDTYEIGFRQQWDRLPEDYKAKMANGIVAFEILVTELQAKEKLSQNKTENERKRIIGSLSNSKDSNASLIADYMKKLSDD